MTSELENLARIGKLKRELPSSREQDGLMQSAVARLRDAGRDSLSFDSRFDLAYNAAHALSLYCVAAAGIPIDGLPQAYGSGSVPGGRAAV